MSSVKAAVRIEEVFAHNTPSIQLPILRSDGFNLNEWRCKLKALMQLCKCLIESTSNVFWSSICLRPQILKELDVALSRFPFFVDVKSGGLFQHLELESNVCDAYSKFLIVFLRLFGSFEREGVSREVFRDFVLQHRILNAKRLSLYCGFFAKNYGVCVRKIVGRLRQIVPELFNIVVECDNALLDIINSSYKMADFMNARSNGGEYRKFDEVHESVNQIYQWRREIVGWNELLRLSVDYRPSNKLTLEIPEMFGVLNQRLDSRVCLNSTVVSEELMHGLTRGLNHLRQLFTQIYLRFYENYTDEEEKIGLIHGLIESPELMARMALQLREQLSGLLEKSKDQKTVSAIRSAIEFAYARKLSEIMQRLHEHHLLDSLGQTPEDSVKEHVQDLAKILPYSKEFLHLALRHFGYNHELTLTNLLEPTMLPFEMRILLNDTKMISAAPPSTTGTVQVDDLCVEDSDIEDEPTETAADRQTDPNDLTALLTATPGTSTRSTTSAPKLSQKELKRQKMEERIRRLAERHGDALNLSELQKLVEQMNRPKSKEETVNVDGKKFAKLYKNNPDDEVNEEDRAILRKKLDEMNFDDEVDSDDEYKKMKLEEQFRTEVGQSGRFNRPQRAEVVADDYDDECDDTYDQPLFNLAENAAVDETRESRQRTSILGPLGLTQQQRHHFNRPTTSTASRPPSAASTATVQMINELVHLNNNRDHRSRNPKLTMQKRNNKKAKAAEKPENERQPTAASVRQSTSGNGYTGGRARMNKERHKGQNKQRGADRKLQRANPF
ncbi:CUE domain-containing protein [Aphelenchoides besseyi]|nr:CUE domain-containing protein [Aphelenchoides besseyi]